MQTCRTAPRSGGGLWVTAQLIDAHGGTISYQQAPDGGATFTITGCSSTTDGAPFTPPASDDAAAQAPNGPSPH